MITVLLAWKLRGAFLAVVNTSSLFTSILIVHIHERHPSNCENVQVRKPRRETGGKTKSAVLHLRGVLEITTMQL